MESIYHAAEGGSFAIQSVVGFLPYMTIQINWIYRGKHFNVWTYF